MKTKTFPLTHFGRNILLGLSAFLLFAILFTSTSCTVGSDGRPGLAYIAFKWEVAKPEYIDCGTPAVPPNFNYDTYYRITPGWYTAYYEGKVWTGQAYGTYAWEMDYEIWINEGQRGGWGYNGKDGMNTYLDFVCSPHGPYLLRHESYLRTARELPEGYELISDNGDEIVVKVEMPEYVMRITYKKSEYKNLSLGGNFALN